MSTRARTFQISASGELLKAARARTPHLPVDIWDQQGRRLVWSGVMGEQVRLKRNKQYLVATILPGVGTVAQKLDLLPETTDFTLELDSQGSTNMDVPVISPIEARIDIYSANLLADTPALTHVSTHEQLQIGPHGRERIALPSTSGSLCFACIRQSGKPALHVAIPQCVQEPSTLLIEARADGVIRPSIEFANPAIDLLLELASEVRPRQVTVLAHSAFILGQTAERIASPLGVLAGAYVMLRNDAQELEAAAKEALLQQLFLQWLEIPDSTVVWAEHNARKGEHEIALQALETLLDRGLPTFSSGIGYALKRLDRYSSLSELELSPVRQQRIRKLRMRLGVFAAALTLGRLITTFPGDDPVLWRTSAARQRSG